MGGTEVLGLTGWAEVPVIMVKSPEGVPAFGKSRSTLFWIGCLCGFMEHTAGNVQ